MMVEKTGSTGSISLHRPSVWRIRFAPAQLVYELSDPTRLSDYLSLPIRSALGSPCGVSELGIAT